VRPNRARSHVEADGAEFREGVAGQVRLGQHHEAVTPRFSKDMPCRIGHRREMQLGDQ
jgi:hypothetical protein